MKPSVDLQHTQQTLIRRIVDAAPEGAVNLGLGQPVFPVPPRLVDAARAAVSELASYSPNAGLPALRDALAQRFGGSADNYLVTTGAEQALFLAIAGMVDPGQHVLLPDPAFPAYELIARWRQAEIGYYPLGTDFSLDVDAVLAVLRPDTRLVVLNSPGNPTGSVFSQAPLQRLLNELEKRDVAWLSDEVYGGLQFGSRDVPTAGQLSHAGFVADSVSKRLALMGWRLGWLRGPADLIRSFLPLQQMTVTCAPVPLQHAVVDAIGDVSLEKAVANEMKARRELALQLWDQLPDVPVPASNGALYLFADVSPWCNGDDHQLAMELLDHGVIVIPGQAFGPGGRGWIRISFGVGPEALEEGFRRLTKGLEALR